MVLSGLFQLPDVASGDEHNASLAATALATGLAFVVGYWSIAFLLRYLARHSLGVFVGYRLVLGAVVLALTAAGTIG